MANETKDKDSTFFAAFNRSALAINQSAAGAGVTGLIGFAGLFVIASAFFVTENFFIAMLLTSLALLVYVTGSEVAKLLLSSATIFFSSKHLDPKAATLQETLVSIEDALEFRRDPSGELRVGPLATRAPIKLSDTPLARDLKAVLDQEKAVEYAEYVAHSYYVEGHELYDYSASHFEFVSSAMPLFGLIGTIVGLIGLFDSLGADVSVESLSPQLAIALKTTLYGAVFSSVFRIIGSRFEQRMKGLEYDFETFCRALQVLVENKTKIEVQR